MALEEIGKRKQEEYEMQLFGFHSRAVNATLKCLMEEKIQSRCERLFDSLEKKYKPDDEMMKNLEKSRKKLVKLYYERCKIYLPIIENLVNKLIAIPKHILLDEDKIQIDQYTKIEFDEMEEKLNILHRKIKCATVVNAALKNELKVAEQFKDNVNTAKKLSEVIKNACNYPEENNKMIKLIKIYDDLKNQIDNFEYIRKKRKTVVQLECKKINLNDL